MGRYSLEVMSPVVHGARSDNASRLAFALESLAVIHGGAVVEPPGASARAAYHRQYVNIFDCESTLEKEVEWLRREFPDTRFTLKEFMQPEPYQHPSQKDSEAGQTTPH